MTRASEATVDDLSFGQRFLVLAHAPRELWLTYFAKVMETAAYAMVNGALMLYLTDNLHFRTTSAGAFVGVFSGVITGATFVAGSVSDVLGVRRTLVYALGGCFVTRLAAALIGHPILSPALAFIPMGFAVALTMPVMVAATKRYSNGKQRSMAFSVLYVMMNVGFLTGGWAFTQIRKVIDKDDTISLLGARLSVYETIFSVAACLTLTGLIPFFLFVRKGIEMPEQSDVPVFREAAPVADGGMLQSLKDGAKQSWDNLAGAFKEKVFYRFLLLLAIVVGVRMVFQHMHFTLPPWSDRELGYGSRFGMAWGVLNPAFIICLAPIAGALSSRVSSYWMLVIGTLLASVPVFLLAAPPDTFSPLVQSGLAGPLKAFLDLNGDLSPIYFNIVIFAALFSVGEAIFSPRLYEYTAAVAPKGREATYMGLSYLPLFLGKLLVGPLSGVLLVNYCPLEGARKSSGLWLVVAVMAVATPALLVLLRGVIKPKTRAEELGTGSSGDSEEPDADSAQPSGDSEERDP